MKCKQLICKYKRILSAFLMALVPVLCCIVTCLIDKKSVLDVYLPASTWNDELYYYKLVEAILEHGYPQGYYGFNESHAQVLSFAAWSPILLLPWVIWGLIFGWNFLSPIICNIFMMALTMFFFTYLAKPGKWQMVAMTVMTAVFTPMVRYSFACMPEITCFMLVILFWALGISYCEKKHNGKIVGMFFLAVLATLMRPYFILLLLLPGYYWFRKNKAAGLLGTLGITGITGVIYIAIKRFLGAEYFTALFNTQWVETFFDEGILEGIKFTLYKLYDVGKQFFLMLYESFISGLPAGALFAAFMLILVLLFVTAFGKWKRKEKDTSVYVHFTFCTFGMWIALLLMYKMTEGSKHLSTFIIAGIMLVSLVATKQFWKWIVTVCLCGFLFIFMAREPINYDIPYKSEVLESQIADIKSQMEANLVWTDSVPSFENTVIWAFSDEVDGEIIQLPWQMLYVVPAEYGINICYSDYIMENLDTLKSRYIATLPGGEIEEVCRQKGAVLVGENEKIVIYQMY